MSDDNYDFVQEEQDESFEKSDAENFDGEDEEQQEEGLQGYEQERNWLQRTGTTFVAGGKDIFTKIKEIALKYLSETETSKLLSFLSDEKKLRLDKRNPEALVCGYILFSNNFTMSSFKNATFNLGDNVSKPDVIKYAYFWKNVISKNEE